MNAGDQLKFKVKIDEFSGPLDLMLYLIKEQKMDLFDLDIVDLADQYIAFIKDAQEQKLDIATEYLSELAGLIEFKSKKLLPRDKSQLESLDYEEEENNLVRRLLEYQRYKEVSHLLDNRYKNRLQLYDKPFEEKLFQIILEDLESEIYYDQSPYDLMSAMEKVLERFHLSNPQDRSIERPELSVEDVIDDVRIFFQNGSIKTLDDVLLDSKNIHELVVRFLAILDLLRMQELRISQKGTVFYLKGVDYFEGFE